MTKTQSRVRLYIKSKRSSNKSFWRAFFCLKDSISIPVHAAVVGIAHKIWLKKWDHHKNITKAYQDRLHEVFKDILTTAARACTPEAEVELHTLTGHYHLNMYLLAVKSLLRFFDGVAIVVHDDGTLNEDDKKLLEDHIIGIQIIDRHRADRELQGLLKKYPHCELYRKNVINAPELLDNILLARTKRIITMNSDILFLSRPQELIDWIQHDHNQFLYVYEASPIYQEAVVKESNSTFPPHVTLALVCFYTDVMDLSLVEHLFTTSKHLIKHPWTAGQNIYPVLFSKKSTVHETATFDRATHEASGIFINEKAVFRHYWSSTGILTEFHIADSKKVLLEL